MFTQNNHKKKSERIDNNNFDLIQLVLGFPDACFETFDICWNPNYFTSFHPIYLRINLEKKRRRKFFNQFFLDNGNI